MTKKNDLKKQDEALNAFLETVVKGFGSMFRSPKRLFGFGLCILFCLSMVSQYQRIAIAFGVETERMQYLIYLVYAVPLIMLAIFGTTGAVKGMTEKFESIKFSNKVGQYPKVKATYRDRGDRRIKIMEFSSSGIPLGEWLKRKEEIESALDVTFLSMKRDADSKQTIIAKTVSSQYKIPKAIDWSDTFIREADFELSLGQGLLGPIVVNLNALPHMIVAGTTGSGKSVTIRYLLWQSIKKGAKLYIVDFKGGVEFDRRWEDFADVVTEKEDALGMLQKLCQEMKLRLSLFRERGVKNVSDYNQKHKNDPLCRIVLACDELAEMIDKDGISDKEEKALIGEIEHCMSSLARLSRAAGIYMILGMQRPDAKVLKGQIKNNAPIRICGRAEAVLSEIVLGSPKASEISSDEQGRFFCNIGGLTEFQGYWFEDHVLVQGDYQKGRMLTNGAETAPLEELNIDETEYVEFEVPRKEQLQWETDIENIKFEGFNDPEKGTGNEEKTETVKS